MQITQKTIWRTFKNTKTARVSFIIEIWIEYSGVLRFDLLILRIKNGILDKNQNLESLGMSKISRAANV